MHPELVRIKNLVITAAREELLPRFNKVSHSFKLDGSVITEADLVMQDRIQSVMPRWYVCVTGRNSSAKPASRYW